MPLPMHQMRQPSGRLNTVRDNPLTQSVTNGFRQFQPMTDSKFGFSSFAEQWNGRLAMMGFVIGLATELLTGQGILGQIGLG